MKTGRDVLARLQVDRLLVTSGFRGSDRCRRSSSAPVYGCSELAGETGLGLPVATAFGHSQPGDQPPAATSTAPPGSSPRNVPWTLYHLRSIRGLSGWEGTYTSVQ